MTETESGFVATKEHRRFVEFCEACRRHRYIGLCYGPPGVGKTLSARTYARWDVLEPFLSRYVLGDEPPAGVDDCFTVFYTPEVANSPRSVDRGLGLLLLRLPLCLSETKTGELYPTATELAARVQLVIVDEADRLKMASLEHLRDTYDRGRFGMILIGMPGMEKRLARYAQLYSRVGFVHAYRPLGAEEVGFVLGRHWQQLGLNVSADDFTDAEAMAAVVRITGGNFRLIHRLLAQIQRILEINELKTVTREVVEAAREGLVIGPA